MKDNRSMKNFAAAIIAVLIAFSGFLSPLALAKSKNPSVGRTVIGVVTHVTDGDTVWVKPSNGSEALDVRIQGIDAPERCQDYGPAARQALSRHILHKRVTLTTRARDKYGRVIGKISTEHQDLGAWMVTNGHAWSYHSRRSAGPYAQQETAARQVGRGLWAYPHAVEPREFRRWTKCHKPRN